MNLVSIVAELHPFKTMGLSKDKNQIKDTCLPELFKGRWVWSEAREEHRSSLTAINNQNVLCVGRRFW